MVNKTCCGYLSGIFHTDPTYPPPPANVTFTDPVVNLGPDAGRFRDPDSGFGRPIDAVIMGNIIYVLEYGGSTMIWKVILPENPPVLVKTKIFLQGPYNDPGMTTILNDNDLLPLSQPYNIPPWNYQGPESVDSIPSTVVDWVLIESQTTPNTNSKVAARAAFVKADGSIVDLDGASPVALDIQPSDYYIVMRHRNHLSIMSAVALMLSKLRFII